jgi:hypothetical protein
MKKLLFFVFCMSILTAGAMAQTGAKPEPVLRVEIEGGSKSDLTAVDLAKLARREVKGKDHDGKEHSFAGVYLKSILLPAGVKFGNDLRGPRLVMFLLVEAAEGYHAVFALAELDNEFTDRVVILADTMDGKLLDAKTGPWQIIVPEEKKHGRWVRQLKKLTVKSAIAPEALTDRHPSEKDLIHKAVFDHLIKQFPSEVYYLSIDWKDPGPGFLQLFDGPGLKVMKGSVSPDLPLIKECENDGPCKKLIGGRLWTANLKYLSKDKVEVAGGENPTNMGGSECHYTLVREGEIWKVTSTDRCMVS